MTIRDAINYLLVLPFPLALLWAMVSDAYRFEIPNQIPIILLAGYLLAALALGIDAWILLQQLAIGFGALLVGMMLFSLGIAGGGDVKLIAACVPWLAPAQLPAFFFWMALAGGLLSVIVILLRRLHSVAIFRQNRWLTRMSQTAKVPYGLAIGCAGFITLPNIPFINN